MVSGKTILAKLSIIMFVTMSLRHHTCFSDFLLLLSSYFPPSCSHTELSGPLVPLSDVNASVEPVRVCLSSKHPAGSILRAATTDFLLASSTSSTSMYTFKIYPEPFAKEATRQHLWLLHFQRSMKQPNCGHVIFLSVFWDIWLYSATVVPIGCQKCSSSQYFFQIKCYCWMLCE